MLVHLADWCYRQPPPGRRPVDRRAGGRLRSSPARSAGSSEQDYLQPGSESQAAAETLQATVPAAGRRHRADRAPLRGRRHLARGRRTGPRSSSPTSPRNAHVVGVASPFTRGRCRPDLAGRHDGVRRRRARQDGQRVHRRRRPRRWSSRSSRPATTPSRSRSAARSRRCPRRRPSARRPSASSPRPSSCCSPSARRWRWGCRSSPRCSASASRWRSESCCAESSTSRTGRPRPRRWSASASASTTPCSSSPGTAAASPRDRTRDARPPTAIATAGRAVVFAGLTVVVSMLGILLIGQPAHDRVRLHRRPGRAGHHDRVVDAAAGPARLRRSRHRTPARAVREQEGQPPTTPPAGTAGAASSSAGPGSPRSADSPSSSRWPRPSSASASASPTPRTTRRPPPLARRTTCWLTGSAPASRRRWCSPSKARPAATCQAAATRLGASAAPGRRGGLRLARRS